MIGDNGTRGVNGEAKANVAHSALANFDERARASAIPSHPECQIDHLNFSAMASDSLDGVP
jgi:hypothetical protein